MIGIRLADGTFFSICSDGPERKSVVLSPANKDQKRAKIDLFRYNDPKDKDGYHIGSLFLDTLGTDDEGNSEIELFIDTDGKRIRAVATDLRGGGRSEFESELPGLVPPAEQVSAQKVSALAPAPVEVKGIRSLQVMMVVLLLMMAFVTGMLLYNMLSAPCVRDLPEFAEVPGHELPPPPPMHKPVPPPSPKPEPSPAPVPPSAPTSPPFAKPEPAPVPAQPAPVPAAPPQEYIRYTVKYGDTLWSLAKDFCNDPYMYKRIAKENNLESPDKLISGTTSIIPIIK